MSQWSKSQDYENLENEVRDIDWSNKGEPLKTVRCVIDKDFEFRRFGNGDDGSMQTTTTMTGIKRESTRVMNVENVRLKNHLEWKRQKEMEYLRKRELERLNEERKKDKKIREEREKRQKEKEREEKIREWQEHKAREKEERKREEMVMKALEQEIKGVTQTIDKEKLIREWIRLKNQQRQMEVKKKAELMKIEEETRALRQSLAEISYKQWKERTKNKRIALPKNGYQIFGPKPIPVVKEDWNHDFGKDDADDRGLSSRTPNSTVSMTSIRGRSLSRIDENFGKRSPSISQLQRTRSRSIVNDFNEGKSEMSLRTIDFDEKYKNFNHFMNHSNERLYHQEKISNHLLIGQPCTNDFTSKMKKFSNTEILPAKNKLSIYLQSSENDFGIDSSDGENLKKFKKSQETLKKYLQGLSDVNSKLLINLNEKLSLNQIKSTCSHNNLPDRRISRERNLVKQPNSQNRRSRSYDKPNNNNNHNNKAITTGNRSLSISTENKSKDIKKTKKLSQKNQKLDVKEKKKSKKASKPEVNDTSYCTRKKTKCNKSTKE